MPVKVSCLAGLMEKIAPSRLAEQWDNAGLLAGRPGKTVQKVMLALDVTPAVAEQAVNKQADMIISHHPLIFHPLKNLAEVEWKPKMLALLIKNDIAVYSAHTSLDITAGGVNDLLAQKLSLRNIEKLHITRQDELLKIAVFVPVSHAQAVAAAMTAGGAGHTGKYSDCTFQAKGTGTFRPLDGTRPFIGLKGRLERVEEVKIETIVPRERRQSVIEAMLKAHPYEEAAYDVYTLANAKTGYAFGRVGELAKKMPVKNFAALVKKVLGLEYVIYTDAGRPVKKIAVCGGAGADFVKDALALGADVLLTGDVKYHTAQEAQLSGLSIVDAGHQGTERHIMPALAGYITEWAKAGKRQLEVLLAAEENIFRLE